MLDNANESPNRLRDIRNGQVALIAGQPAVPKSALPLTCPPAKCIRMRVPMWPNCARTGSAPEAPRMFCGPDRQGEGLGPGRGSGAELSGAIWASEGKPSPRAPSQHLQLATNPLSHARMPGPLHLLLHLAPQQLSAHARACLLELDSCTLLTHRCHRSQARARATSTT